VKKSARKRATLKIKKSAQITQVKLAMRTMKTTQAALNQPQRKIKIVKNTKNTDLLFYAAFK